MERERKIKIAKIVLGVIAVGGLVAIAAVAPNSLKILDLFYDKKKKPYDVYKKRHYINITINRLKKQGLVEFYKKEERTFLQLSAKGRQELLKYQMREKMIEKPKRWDKKWRVVIFDIKEQARNLRDGLRQELTNLGFVKLQNSVWAYPYECEEIIAMLKTYFKIGQAVIYMTVEKVENDNWLREKFGLV